MTTTVKAHEVIIDALENLVVQAEEAPVPQSEAKAAIRALNDMMFAWDTQGITLGYTVVSNTGDPITVAPGAIEGIKYNLALRLAPKYDVVPSPALVTMAKLGYSTCVDIAVEIADVELPDTLPQGSGNDYPDYGDSTFFPDQTDTILTESGGSVGLEDDTEES